jgi:hypothetical protein
MSSVGCLGSTPNYSLESLLAKRAPRPWIGRELIAWDNHGATG